MTIIQPIELTQDLSDPQGNPTLPLRPSYKIPYIPELLAGYHQQDPSTLLSLDGTLDKIETV